MDNSNASTWQCKDCGAEVDRRITKCRCGGRQRVGKQHSHTCAWAGCDEAGVFAGIRQDEWFCSTHQPKEPPRNANKQRQAMGKEMLKFARQDNESMGAWMQRLKEARADMGFNRVPGRVPGEDDDLGEDDYAESTDDERRPQADEHGQPVRPDREAGGGDRDVQQPADRVPHA